jgi:hypothetical protein
MMTDGLSQMTQTPNLNGGLSTNSNTPTPNYQGDYPEFKRPDIATLNGYYTDGDGCDQEVFAEMRSSILLIAGEHYSKKRSMFYRRIRDTKDLTHEQRIRITKNHVRKICQVYANNILAPNPGVGFSPKDNKSMHDMKVAELHKSVWYDAVHKYNLDDKMDDWVDSFIGTGEINLKLFYDPSLGSVTGYEAKLDEETGEVAWDEMGMPIADETKPVMSGEFVFEEIYGFNMLRPPECKDLRKAEWIGIRKMVNRPEAVRLAKGNDDLIAKLVAGQDETYVIFDALNGGYKKSNKQVMIREYYFRPSTLFPDGYFYITTKEGILAEGPLPGGLFPIISIQFDKIPTTPRGRGPVKTMRPYQAEINRAGSKMAEHQITLGDDKLIIQNGQKASEGARLAGVRMVTVTGQAPTILAGRSGAQYLEYMQAQITELYQVMMVAETSEDQNLQLDPYVMLFRAAKDKKKFQRYIKRFEKFLIEVAKLYIALAKIHLPDDAVIMAIGKNEQVNIAEFRKYPDTCCEVNIESQAEDIETKLGKQLVINQALQYVGSKLERDDIGKLMRASPMADFDEIFDDFTLDYDKAENEMLALDRGELPPVGPNDNHVYMIKRLTNRQSKPDFRFLPPAVQNNYQVKIQIHNQMEAANQMQIQRAESGFIPTGGGLIACDYYVQDPANPNSAQTRRARIPYQAVQWLIEQLSSQGASQDQLEAMNSNQQAGVATEFLKQVQGPPQVLAMRRPMIAPGLQTHAPMAARPAFNNPMPTTGVVGHS